MGEVFNEDTLLDIALEGFPDEYTHIKYSAQADNDCSLNEAVITMRDMYANRVLVYGPSRKRKGRESAIFSATTSSAIVTPRNDKRHDMELSLIHI